MKKFLIPALFLVISSCSGNVKKSWNCPPQESKKGSCITISEADNIKSFKDKEGLMPQSYSENKQKIEINLVAPKLKDLKKLNLLPQNKYATTTQDQSKLRTEEKVGKVWFAPYIDSDGNQHGDGVIYVVDEKAKWVSQR